MKVKHPHHNIVKTSFTGGTSTSRRVWRCDARFVRNFCDHQKPFRAQLKKGTTLISYPTGNLYIPAAHGRLEAILKDPRDVHDKDDAPNSLRGVALVLHPHPLHGGTMHNKVVYRTARALNTAGLVTLRINFRGVGLSTGTHDNARGEGDDARHALDYLTGHYPDQPITLAGFSFGARVGLEVGIGEDRVDYLIGVGTPVNMYDFSFLAACRKPLLLVHGSEDEFGDVEKLMNTAQLIKLPGSDVSTRIVNGAEHFFKNHLDEMESIIRDWMVTMLTMMQTIGD